MNVQLVFCTAPDLEVARRLAALLLERRLVACVSIIPQVESHYVWEESRECSTEVQMLIKTTENNWEELQQTILEAHPYECPEILSVRCESGLPEYMKWIADSVQ